MTEKMPEKDYIAAREAAKPLKESKFDPIEITLDVPIPLELRGGTRKWDHFFPFEDMKQVGASFWVPKEHVQSARSMATAFTKRTGWKFVSRAQSKEGVPNAKVGDKKQGVRIWRIE